MDCADPGEVEEMAGKAIQEFGRIDVVVNGAWWMDFKADVFADMAPDAVDG